jgi:hypothetical protein
MRSVFAIDMASGIAVDDVDDADVVACAASATRVASTSLMCAGASAIASIVRGTTTRSRASSALAAASLSIDDIDLYFFGARGLPLVTVDVVVATSVAAALDADDDDRAKAVVDIVVSVRGVALS